MANQNVRDMNMRVASMRGVVNYGSGNKPTVACVMSLTDGKTVVFKVPAGASTGEREAALLPPKEAAANINRLAETDFFHRLPLVTSQEAVDGELLGIDGTPNKSKLGGNTTTAISAAYALAKAHWEGVELWEQFTRSSTSIAMPVPQFNVLNGGKHVNADPRFIIQETMVIPHGAGSFAEAVDMGVEVWHALRGSLKKEGKLLGLGAEGGFQNPYSSVEQVIAAVLGAIEKAGHTGKVALAFDGAFSEIFGSPLDKEKVGSGDGNYHMGENAILSPEQMVEFWANLVSQYPVISIEDGMGENDWAGWKLMTDILGKKVQLVADDLICTNPEIIRKAIQRGDANSSLIKLNQIGTMTETLIAMELTARAGRTNVISHRSGETEDDFIAHLAMHRFAHQLKCGSSGAERFAKYNKLIIIEALLGSMAYYPGIEAFPAAVQEYWQVNRV